MHPDKKVEDDVGLTAEEVIALDLFIQGHNYQQVAEEMGVSHTTAWRRVQSGVKKRFHQITDDLDQWILQQVEYLLKALKALEGSVKSGDVQAIDRAVKVFDRLSKLLGLDKPTKVAPTDPTGEFSYFDLDPRERALRIDRLLDLARERRSGEVAEDGDLDTEQGSTD